MAAKKEVKKKTVSKTKKITKTQFLAKLKKPVPENLAFNLVNGTKITSVKQLSLEIDRMPDEVFYYHVNDYKNDFVPWLTEIVMDADLAGKIAEIKDKKDMQITILEYIVKNL